MLHPDVYLGPMKSQEQRPAAQAARTVTDGSEWRLTHLQLSFLDPFPKKEVSIQ